MKNPLARATACPECGRRVCSVLRRICAFLGGRVQTHCLYCGCPCDTPLPIYITMLAAGAAGACGALARGGDIRDAIVWLGLGYGLTGIPMMVLFPLRARAGTRAVQPLIRLRRPFDYQADDVWHAAQNVLRRRRYHYQVLAADPVRRELEIRRKAKWTEGLFRQCIQPPYRILVQVEPAEEGGARMVVQLPRGRVEDDLPRAGTELKELCDMIQEELEGYRCPKAGRGRDT